MASLLDGIRRGIFHSTLISSQWLLALYLLVHMLPQRRLKCPGWIPRLHLLCCVELLESLALPPSQRDRVFISEAHRPQHSAVRNEFPELHLRLPRNQGWACGIDEQPGRSRQVLCILHSFSNGSSSPDRELELDEIDIWGCCIGYEYQR